MLSLDQLLSLSESVRYAAILRNDELETRSKPGRSCSSAKESDRYEETLVNPTVLKLTSQRGNIDCGGLDYVIIRYGHFFQAVIPTRSGHLSICVEPEGDPLAIAAAATTALESAAS